MGTARLGPVTKPPRIQLGDVEVTLLDGGQIWLDGGAMFGIIPKPMWARLTEVDDQNRVPLAMTCLLLETSGKRIIVETGAGPAEKYHEKEQGRIRFGGYWLLDSLKAAGIDRESIDYVIMTHMHFDHAGGGTMPDGRGGYRPTFPKARYVVQRGEWEDAVAGFGVVSTTYRKENLAPLEAAGVLSLVNGEAEIASGIRVLPLPGHTRHQQGVIIHGGDAKAVQPADMMPTAAHCGIRFNMAYDLLPYENMKNKERLLDQALREDWRMLIGQDPTNAVWRVQSDGRGGVSLTP